MDPLDVCFNLALDTFTTLKLRIEKISQTDIELQFTFNGAGPFTIVDNDETEQPEKIDLIAVHFSNARPYRLVTLQQ